MAHLCGCCVCVCSVLCFVLPPKQSSVLECHHISYFEKWKLWAMFFGKFLCWSNYDRKKIQQDKKGTVLVFLASVLKCHHISYVERWKLWDIYLLTLNKKWKMKIMGKVARFILVVAVSVCVVFCVLCCFQNNPVFSSVTIFHMLKNGNYELCLLQISSSIKLRLGKITKGKKGLC